MEKLSQWDMTTFPLRFREQLSCFSPETFARFDHSLRPSPQDAISVGPDVCTVRLVELAQRRVVAGGVESGDFGGLIQQVLLNALQPGVLESSNRRIAVPIGIAFDIGLYVGERTETGFGKSVTKLE